jgi:outer membrane receptor for ferrienterochelin and colicins
MSTLFTAGHHSRDAYDLDPSTESTTGSAIHQFDVANDSRLELTPDTAMMTHIGYMRRTLEGVDLSGTGAVFDRTNVIEEFQSSVRPRWVPNERELWSIDGAFSMYRDQYLADQRGSGALDKYEDTREHLGQATVQHDRFMGERHHVTLGMDGLAQTMRSERLSEGEGQRLGVAFFAQDVWEIYDGPSRLTLVPGARLDLDTSFGVYPTPKMGLRYDPSDAVAIRASYGWGYRAPVFKELLLLFENPGAGYVVEGNPELDPETSQSVQLGLEVDPIPWLWVSSNAFYNQVDDLISIGTLAEAEAGEPTRYGYVNIASATTRGLEAATRVELAELAAVHLSYTLTDSIDQELDRPLEGRALHRATAKLTGGPTASGLHGLVRAGYVGSRPFYIDTDNDQIEETIAIDPYVTLDARVAKHFGPVLEIFAGADNLLNVGDASFTQVPPRFFYLGLNGRFAKASDPSPS